MSGESERKRSAAQIEADLAATREELTRTVDELSERVDPRRQVKEATEKARTEVSSFVAGLKAGDPKAIGIAGAAAATVLAIVGLSVRRHRT
ncbi:DUF3618 domain-containing protein [Ruania suaedae]|uniref:DUF3618 domain-containing protein n=1 Tax=Ruania suaedae TaxID=2897774 RepID=UPI001E30BA7E|nr:DUF3618 domain-containing protein [Ruania suaedae]UFU02630.1 DUF3618 domain-containing protein [Ruania suaedae]